MSRQGKGGWVAHLTGRPSCGVRSQVRDCPPQPHPLSRTALLGPRRGRREGRCGWGPPTPSRAGRSPPQRAEGPVASGREVERTLSPTRRAEGPAPVAPGAGLRVQGSAGAATPARQGTEPGGAAAPDPESGAGVPGDPTAHARGPRRGAGRERPGRDAGVGAAASSTVRLRGGVGTTAPRVLSASPCCFWGSRLCLSWIWVTWKFNRVESVFVLRDHNSVSSPTQDTRLASKEEGHNLCLRSFSVTKDRATRTGSLPGLSYSPGARPQVRGHAFAGLSFKLTGNTGNAFSIVFGSFGLSK